MPKPMLVTGLLKEMPDARAIQLESFQAPVSLPVKYKTDISKLPIDDQGARGSCVWNSIIKAMQLLSVWENKDVPNLSWRFGYGITKAIDNMPNVEGTFISLGLKVAHDTGCADAYEVANDTNLPHLDFIRVPRTPEIFRNAYDMKIQGYVSVDINPPALKQAIFQNGFFIAGIAVGTDTYKLPLKPMPFYGWHALFFFGYEDQNDGSTDFYFINSWGKNWGDAGIGRINTKDYFLNTGNYFLNAFTITDIPQKYIDEAKRKTYRPEYNFNKPLTFGMTDNDVRILQDVLKYEGCLDPKEVPISTRYYGPKTAEGVQRFQERYALGSGTELYTLGGKRVGPSTLAILKKYYASTTKLIDKWCLATQQREGYYAPGEHKLYPNGTPSWRNKNPGNLKHVGQAKAIGKDKSGFCIFATYQDGYDELKSLLTRAATTGAGSYKPDMTLLEFYHVYAPTEDQNDPASYAHGVAKALGVDVNIKIKELVK